MVIAVLVVSIGVFTMIQGVALAQSPPTNSTPVQRTIVEEGAESFSTTEQVGQVKSSNNSTVYGLLATGLIILAAGAVFVLWRNAKPKTE